MPLLLCQRDSYLRSITTRVRSCVVADGGYRVVLEETVLFPEGGGQPCDHGTVAGLPVRSVGQDENGEVVHLLEAPVEGQVEVIVDWRRRYDHMQQHTAQHLLTAVAQDRYGLVTTAFHLGAERCDIELNCANIAGARLNEIEAEVNAHVRADLPVTAREVSREELARTPSRSRGLPESVSGPVRLVEIESVDSTTCCGTHLRRTSELQAVTIAGSEPIRGATRVFFLAGGRVLRAVQAAVDRERALTRLLSCGAPEHEAAVSRLLDETRSLRKAHRDLRLELGAHIGAALASEERVVSLHRSDADMDFLRAVANGAAALRPEQLLLLTGGGDRDQGIFLLRGPEREVRRLGPEVATALDGRGGGSGSLYQGKAARIENRDAALKLLRRSASSAPDGQA